LCKKEGLVCLL
nr:immunoglobulin heavy chain junction region [Mus musculus]